ncbi:type II secretion system F family protein [Cupriavidus gilardii]|uniref:Type II secretion system F family protein n=2 Tax=Cupriavidus gilardii TaxID=82541 RepID=A0ABY4VW52_9BURK|nr:type II secretion system F family protein [Cupriavidus gilardii]USE81557.1 type II secretion system F family protein [Cupriavidus gilardii]
MGGIMEAMQTQQWLLLGLVFIAAFGAALGLMLVCAPNRLRARLERLGGGTAGPAASSGAGQAGSDWSARLGEWARPVSRFALPREGWENSALRVRFMNAGWRGTTAPTLYFAAKTVLALALPLAALVATVGTPLASDGALLAVLLIAICAVGYYLPNAVLARRIAQRKRAVFEEFPDAIDLLTVCVEAGLGLDAALMRVAGELSLRCPVLANELELMLLEMRSGFSKEKALSNLALRTGVDDVERFAAMLVQADRFGTSLGESLRVLSDMLRTKRRMLAEEQAAKIALKLLFPLIFLIFPSLLVVLLGPAFIQIVRVLLPTMTGQGG